MSDPFCPRQITFELAGMPGVVITATENGGAIDFIVDVEDTPETTADLRALFFHFNESKLGDLVITSSESLFTESRIQANSVLDLGDNANLAGAVKSGFDIGIEWGTPGGKKDDISFPVTFTLSNAANDLTLDDFATMLFGAKLDSVGGPGGPRGGASKVLGVAPWAPDAKNDEYTIYEDGATAFDDPSKSPRPVVFNVLVNDEDKDLDELTIIAVHGPSHGTVAISADGKSVLYTPDLDYSGEDSFEYCVSDGNGGQDHARVDVTVQAVADRPVITYTVVQGATINEMLVTVTARQDDADSSEYLDRIDVGALPAGVTLAPLGVNPGDEPDVITQQFLLTTPARTDVDFDLNFTAFSRETSNGDQESATETVPIVIEFNHNETDRTFVTENQSIWDSGGEFIWNPDLPFLGIENMPLNFDETFLAGLTPTVPPLPIILSVETSGHLTFGFDATVELKAGGIDISLIVRTTIDTTYNKTTDALLIESSSSIVGGSFTTQGPSGLFKLDFVADFALNYSVELEPIGDFVNLSGSIPPPDANPFPIRETIIDVNSNSPEIPYTVLFPGVPPGVATITFDWPRTPGLPYLETKSDPGTLTSHGESSDFLRVDADIDEIATWAFPLLRPIIDPNPLDPDNFELLDIDLSLALKLVQDFAVQFMGMKQTQLRLEGGDEHTLTFGQPLTLTGISDQDANDDGKIDFALSLTPDADLSNNSQIRLDFGASFALLKNLPIIDETLWESGPLTLPIVGFEIFNKSFDINGFQSQDWAFSVA